ncbi:hypothetical protein LEMLEM_LOCUS26014 [Lemmus lemmus]
MQSGMELVAICRPISLPQQARCYAGSGAECIPGLQQALLPASGNFSSTWSPCPASMHWHHLNGLAGVGYIHWKRACPASSASCSFIFPTKWTELRCEKNVDTFDPEDTGSLE